MVTRGAVNQCNRPSLKCRSEDLKTVLSRWGLPQTGDKAQLLRRVRACMRKNPNRRFPSWAMPKKTTPSATPPSTNQCPKMESCTVDQIKALLDRRQVKYSSSDNKRTLYKRLAGSYINRASHAKSVARKNAARRAGASGTRRAAPARRSPARRSPARRSPARRSTARKSTARKSSGGMNAWARAVKRARKQLGITGFQAIKKGSKLYKTAKANMK